MKSASILLRPLAGVLFAPLLVITLVACEALLEVENPGNVPEESLLNPDAIPTVVDGVYGDLVRIFDDFVLRVGLFTDEFVHSGSFPDFNEFDIRMILTNNPGLDDLWEVISIARFTGDRAAAQIRTLLGPDAESDGFLAAALAYSGYAHILIADNFCQAAFDAGPAVTPEDVYRRAEERFTDALQVATAAESDSIFNLSLVGRARTRLNLGDNAGAIADAQQVPADFVFLAQYEELQQENIVFIFTISRREVSVDEPFRNLDDPRVPVCFGPECPFRTEGAVGPDNETPLFVQLKYLDRGADIRIASGAEAALIAREAMGEDVAEERARELWLEGHRLADFRRRNDPFLAGGDQCWPFPDEELDTNPNL